MGRGGGLFSKTRFSAHPEPRCTDVGSLGNWCTAARSGEVESFIKPQLQTFKRPASAFILQHHASQPQRAREKICYAFLQCAGILHNLQPSFCPFTMHLIYSSGAYSITLGMCNFIKLFRFSRTRVTQRGFWVKIHSPNTC